MNNKFILLQESMSKADMMERQRVEKTLSSKINLPLVIFFVKKEDLKKLNISNDIIKIINSFGISWLKNKILGLHFDSVFNKCNKRTDHINDIYKCKIASYKYVINKISQNKSACFKTNDPNSCNERLMDEVKRYQKKIESTIKKLRK